MNLSELTQALANLKSARRHKVWRPFMEAYNCQVIAEIGVREGKNFVRMIEHQPQIAVAIDAWADDDVPQHNDCAFSQTELDQQYANFARSMTSQTSVKIYREYSCDAVRHFPNQYFDLIYIDADHTYGGCLGDIERWYPKLKEHKFLVGDDYVHQIAPNGVRFAVIEAVNDFAKHHGLTVYELPRYGWAIIKPKK